MPTATGTDSPSTAEAATPTATPAAPPCPRAMARDAMISWVP